MSPLYVSTYIIDRDPARFGNQQEDYVNIVQQVVKAMAKKIHKTMQHKTSLESRFFKILKGLGDIRHQIAQQHNTEDADFFGTFRHQNPTFQLGLHTSMGDQYDEYNDKLLVVVQQYLRTMQHTYSTFEQRQLRVEGKSYCGRAYSTEVSILKHEDLARWGILFTFEECKKLCELCSLPPPTQKTSDFLSTFNEIVNNKKKMQELKTSFPQYYQRLRLGVACKHIQQDCPDEEKSEWVLITTQLEIDGRMHNLSQYLTWLCLNGKDDPIQRMTDESIVTIIHVDPLEIDPILHDTAKAFKEVIRCDKANVDRLKEKTAFMEYMLAHATPFNRGSAAIEELIVGAACNVKALNLTYNPKKSVNLEALTSSLSDFIENYGSMVNLTEQQKV